MLEISTLWRFTLPLLIQMFIKAASSPRLSGIGMHCPILWSHLLKMQRIVFLSSLLWWELGTNSLITGPGEWLSFRRFTSKLSWPWVNRWKGWVFTETFPSIYGRDKSVYFRSWGCYVPYHAIIIRKKKKKKKKKSYRPPSYFVNSSSNYYACGISRSLHYVDLFCCLIFLAFKST